MLAFDLYHNTRNGPELMWMRTFSGTVSDPNGVNNGLTVRALSGALDQMIRGLVEDLPQIRGHLRTVGAEAAAGAPPFGS